RFSRDWSSDVCSSDLAEHAGGLALDERFRRRDVGLDHKLLDQHMRGEALAPVHGLDEAVLTKLDPALRYLEIERLAPGPCYFERLIGAVERADHIVINRRGLFVRMALMGILHLSVGERGEGADHRAHEAVAEFPAVRQIGTA